MTKLLYSFLFFYFISYNLIGQVIVNEIIYKNEGFLKFEVLNNSAFPTNIKSIKVLADTTELINKFQDFTLSPYKLSIIELNLNYNYPQLEKIFIEIGTDTNHDTTIFNGCILVGESAGRFPDIEGEFIVYNNSQISTNKSNYSPGILVKKTSKTKFTPRDSSPNAALYYNGFYWIFGGWDYNYDSNTWSSKVNVWNSKDGIDWTLINDHPPYENYSGYVVFNNKMMVIQYDSVFMSNDGIIWEKFMRNPFFGGDSRFVVFNDKLYTLYSNIMGESTDGINWQISNTDLPSDELGILPALVSSGDKLWLYGGRGCNSVWNSNDGLHWVKIINHAPWSARKWFNYSFFDNKLWMIAGNDEPSEPDTINFGNLQDFWYSSDGINWNLLETDSSFYNRHASLLWNDGERILISSGFGNNEISRMYNDVWELSVKNLFLTSNNFQETLDLSIFPDRYVNYLPNNTDHTNIYIAKIHLNFSTEDTHWLNEKITLGNSIDSTSLTFKESLLYNTENWNISHNGVLEFTNTSILGKNPKWNFGSCLFINNSNQTDSSFTINMPYNLIIENSHIKFQSEASSINTFVKKSSLTGEMSSKTIFKTSNLSLENVSTDDKFWLSNFDNSKLILDIKDDSTFIPNLIIKDTNIEIKPNQKLIRKIQFLDNLMLENQYDFIPDVKIYLSGNKKYSEKILENFHHIPKNIELDNNSVFETEKTIDISETDFYNKGLFIIGSNEVKLKSYFELDSTGYIIMNDDGSMVTGLSNNVMTKNTSLTFSNENFENHNSNPQFIKIKIIREAEDKNNEIFRFVLKNTNSLLYRNNYRYQMEYFNKTIEIEPIINTDLKYNLYLSIINKDFQFDKHYNYLYDNVRLKDFKIIEPVDSTFLFHEYSQFSTKRSYSFFNNSNLNWNNNFIFPNPNHGIITILNVKQFSLRIFDIVGRQIFYGTFFNDNTIFEKDFKDVFKKDGIYIVTLFDYTNGQSFSQKIVVTL